MMTRVSERGWSLARRRKYGTDICRHIPADKKIKTIVIDSKKAGLAVDSSLDQVKRDVW
jgi:hypothetical protein